MVKTVLGLALALWMLVMFQFSSQPFNEQNLRPWVIRNLQEEHVVRSFHDIRFHYGGHLISIDALGAPGFVEFFVRKAAHLTEYAVLGSLLFLYVRYVFRVRRYAVPLVVLACFVFAISDEFHQSFVFQRTPLAQDVLLDMCGACAGIAMGPPAKRFWRWAMGRTKGRRKELRR